MLALTWLLRFSEPAVAQLWLALALTLAVFELPLAAFGLNGCPIIVRPRGGLDNLGTLLSQSHAKIVYT